MRIALIATLLLPSFAAASNPFLNGAPYRACPSHHVMKIADGHQAAMIPELAKNSARRLLLFEQIVLPNRQDEETTRKVVAFGNRRVPEVLQKIKALGLVKEIKKVAALYDVDPAQVLAPIVVEMSFNGFIDRALQDGLVALKKSELDRKSAQLKNLLKDRDVQKCMAADIENYWKWKCVDFFNSAYNGAHLGTALSGIGTYGIAQFNPVLVWSYNDIVAARTGQKKMEFGDFESALKTVLSPTETLHYIAASVARAIKIYREVACFEIGAHLGLTSTIYNLGDDYQRAYVAKNRYEIMKTGPTENYFGWFATEFETEIRRALR